jgi:hypothetical protein
MSLSTQALDDLNHVAYRAALETGQKGKVGYIVYGSNCGSSAEVAAILSQTLLAPDITIKSALVDALGLTAQEVQGDKSDQVGMRILYNLEKLPFLDGKVLEQLPPLSAINEAYRNARKSYNPALDEVLEAFNAAHDEVQKILLHLTSRKVALPQKLWQILTLRPTIVQTHRVTYDSASMLEFLSTKCFRKNGTPLVNLHLATIAYRFITAIQDYKAFNQPTLVVISEETYKSMWSLSSNYFPLQDSPFGVVYLDTQDLPRPGVNTIEGFTQWINE